MSDTKSVLTRNLDRVHEIVRCYVDLEIVRAPYLSHELSETKHHGVVHNVDVILWFDKIITKW